MGLVVITGGIGSGKSTVLARFAWLGGVTLDADALVHALYAPGNPLLAEFRERWGSRVFTAGGGIDRKVLAGIVFSDPAEVSWLNARIHPLVCAQIQQAVARTAGAVYCAVPLWHESGWQEAEAVVSVWCDPETQVRRLQARGWSLAEIEARLRHQLSMDEKLRRSDLAVISRCSMATLHRQCDVIYRMFS